MWWGQMMTSYDILRCPNVPRIKTNQCKVAENPICA
jgi:hypothetical protein